MAGGSQAEIAKQLVVLVAFRIRRGQQSVSNEDRIGSGQKTESGGLARK